MRVPKISGIAFSICCAIWIVTDLCRLIELTWKPTCCTSCALTTCVSLFLSRKLMRASQLKKFAVPRLVLKIKPSFSSSSSCISGSWWSALHMQGKRTPHIVMTGQVMTDLVMTGQVMTDQVITGQAITGLVSTVCAVTKLGDLLGSYTDVFTNTKLCLHFTWLFSRAVDVIVRHTVCKTHCICLPDSQYNSPPPPYSTDATYSLKKIVNTESWTFLQFQEFLWKKCLSNDTGFDSQTVFQVATDEPMTHTARLIA